MTEILRTDIGTIIVMSVLNPDVNMMFARSVEIQGCVDLIIEY